MLHKIRKTTNSIIFRIFIGLLAVAFAWSFRDAMGFGDDSFVTFKNVPAIKRSEYEKARYHEVSKLQRTEGLSFTDEQLDEMGVPQGVLQRIIVSRLIKFLALDYNLDFGDAAIANLIKKYPVFKNEDNLFDIERFHAFLRNNNINSEEFSEDVKFDLSRNILLGSLVGNAYIPKARTENLINYLSEKRIIDVAIMPLFSEVPLKVKASEEELKNFYNENKDLFKNPWKRDICYLTVDQAAAKNHIKVTEQDIKNFYDENRSEFEGKKLSQVRDQILAYLKKEKFDYWISVRTKSFDDEVAAGSSLTEIASKHNLEMKCEKNISSNNIGKKASGIFTPFLSDIYDMNEGEVSYPADLEDGGLILFEIAKYVPESFMAYDTIKNKVKDKYAIFSHRQEKIRQAGEFVSNISAGNFVRFAKEKNMKLLVGKQLVRSNISEDDQFPKSMLDTIFASAKDNVLGPFIEADKAYLFVVKSISFDKKAQKDMRDEKSALLSSIKEDMTDELLMHAQKESNMKVKIGPNRLKMSRPGDGG